MDRKKSTKSVMDEVSIDDSLDSALSEGLKDGFEKTVNEDIPSRLTENVDKQLGVEERGDSDPD